MKRALAALSMSLLLGATPALGHDEARAVEESLHVLCKAFEDGDIATMEKFIDERFSLIATDAVQTTRAEEIASVRDGHADYDVFRNHDMTTRVYGDTAVVTGITTVAGRWDGTAFARDLRFTDTLIKRDGQWILLASHASPIPEPSPAAKPAE
jgi:ketosteroid isomerase-like protein